MRSKYIVDLELINRKLRNEVKKEVAANYDRLISRIDELEEENKKLRECVEFYADIKNHNHESYGCVDDTEFMEYYLEDDIDISYNGDGIFEDDIGGKKARQTLKELEAKK